MDRHFFDYVNGSINSSVSRDLKDNWDKVKNFLSRLRNNGIKARDVVLEKLKKAFSWMTDDDADEAYYQYYYVAARALCSNKLLDAASEVLQFALASLDEYDFLSIDDKNIIYLDKELPNGNHEYWEYDGNTDKVIQCYGNDACKYEPGTSVSVKQFDDLLHTLDSIQDVNSTTKIASRRGGKDEPRESFWKFLQTVDVIKKRPATVTDVRKDDYSDSEDKDKFAAYYYTFLAEDGANYTIEFLVDLSDNTGSIWVEDETNGTPLGNFPVDDVLDLDDYELNLLNSILEPAVKSGPKTSKASNKTFDSVEQLQDFYKKSKISAKDAAETLVVQFDYDSNGAAELVESWGKNYYESTHKVSSSYYGYVIPSGEPNEGSYAVTDEDNNVVGVFPDKNAAIEAGFDIQ